MTPESTTKILKHPHYIKFQTLAVSIATPINISLVPRPHFLHPLESESDQLPIPFSVKFAGALTHCSFLI